MFFIPYTVLLEEKLKYEQMDKDLLDDYMGSICRFINLHPRVVSLFSCDGHQTLEEPRQHFYLTLATSDRKSVV